MPDTWSNETPWRSYGAGVLSDSRRGPAHRRFTIAACVAAGITLVAACGSSASGPKPSKPAAGGTVFAPAGDGFVQAWHVSGDNRRQITIAKPDGSTAHRVSLPFEPLTAFPVGGGKVLYTSTGSSLALVDSDSGAATKVSTPDDDYSPSNVQLSFAAPYVQRYLLLQPHTLTHSVLLDVTSGKTFDIASRLGGDGLVTYAVSSPDGSHVLFGDSSRAVLLTPDASGGAHQFEDFSFPSCFTADGTAIVIEQAAGQGRRVVAFDPASGKTRTLKERPHADGPVIATCAGSTVVVTAGSGGGIDLVPVAGGTSRHLTAVPKDLSRVVPASDGRHVLLGSGSDADSSWWMLDIDAGTVAALPALSGANPGGGTLAQRYRVFLPAGTSPGSLGSKLLGFDSYTGKVTPLTFSSGRVVTGTAGTSSADGKIRSFLGSSLAVSSYVADLSTGSVRSYPHPTSVSPAGDRLLQTIPRRNVQITDLQSKTLASLAADTGVWTAT